MKRPIHQMLVDQQGRTSFHMPGHKGREPFVWGSPYKVDTTELMTTDDLYHPVSGIFKAEELIARQAGAAQSFLLTGGSTAGILAMILYAAKEGEEIILPRSGHKSLTHGCALAGAMPIYVYPRYTDDGYAYYTKEDYIAVIKANPSAKGVVVTRPDYYGHLLDLGEIAAAAREQGQLLLVDEAHGAHFNWFLKDKGAGALGADYWVQSAHKTLPVLTGGAWLHSREKTGAAAMRQMIEIVQTSSPSFVIIQSLDDGRAWMEGEGVEKLCLLAKEVQGFFNHIAQTPYLNAFTPWQKRYGLQFDPLRMVIKAPQGGFALQSALAREGIDVEMADDYRVVCILSVMTLRESFIQLGQALKKIPGGAPRKQKENAAFPHLLAPKQRVALRAALFGDKEPLPLQKAVGRVCARAAGPYPPGVPWLLPGEEVTREIAQMLGDLPPNNTFGLENQQLLCLK